MTKYDNVENNGEKRGKSAVPAVEKALDVIELLAGTSNGLTMNEIVDALQRTMGEVYRVVIYLAERGYLVQDANTARYSLTLQLFELAHRHNPTERLIQAALPMLGKIAGRSNQSCHLGVLNRTHVLVLASTPSPMPAGYSVRTGAMFPVVQTSSGHVILAFSTEADQELYLARLPEKERKPVVERFARIRLAGFEDTPSTMIQGVRNLCVPVFDTRGIVAAITSGFIGQTDAKVTAEETLHTLRETAIELSQTLGFRLKDSAFEAALTS